MKKIAAFTIIEIVVVLAISTVVAGLAFSVISVVQKNKASIENAYQKKSIIKQLELALKIDFNKYSQVTWNKQEEQLIFSSPIASKSYTFVKDSVYTTDQSFKLSKAKVELYFMGDQIKNGEVDGVKLIFLNKFTLAQHLFVSKINDKTVYFRL